MPPDCQRLRPRPPAPCGARFAPDDRLALPEPDEPRHADAGRFFEQDARGRLPLSALVTSAEQNYSVRGQESAPGVSRVAPPASSRRVQCWGFRFRRGAVPSVTGTVTEHLTRHDVHVGKGGAGTLRTAGSPTGPRRTPSRARFRPPTRPPFRGGSCCRRASINYADDVPPPGWSPHRRGCAPH